MSLFVQKLLQVRTVFVKSSGEVFRLRLRRPSPHLAFQNRQRYTAKVQPAIMEALDPRRALASSRRRTHVVWPTL